MKKFPLIHQKATITEGLRALNQVQHLSRLILFVVDDQERVIGSVTDGDIRRSIAAEENLQKTLGEICNTSFRHLKQGETFQSFEAFRKADIKILPVLDAENRMVDLFDLNKIKANLPLEVMLMAGGRGKRLSPLTDTTPKPMLPLGGKPIIEHNIDRLISFGIKKIYISVKYLAEQIIDHLGDGSEKGIEIEYIREDQPLGTAGALSLVEKFNTDYVLLMNSDLFTSVDFESLYRKIIDEGAEMAIASTEYKVDVPYAVFETEQDQVVGFKEKPSYIYHANAGVYILKRELINEIPKNQFFDITDLMDSVVDSGRKLVYDPIIGYWIDIGKPVDYTQAQEFVKHLEK
ncbi:nucleotidyltransferase family protein [Riemerella columbina]|uniref:nucleotidyltransferase family protein n=1 Tax=Riemerella columbina TaxID=103810 RepID=UPI00266F087D|nr:nucleotidyltransferase family protein [Riemerella columbina]WKS95152.1 nucleotidyltransferase family protein [Riemerella columbina]